jgi:type VI secretion system protein ImpE
VSADQHFKAGQLQEALDAQLKAVKADPADHGKRIFLFELLVFAGDLERARKQISLVDYGELELDAAVLTYNKLLDAEAARRNLFTIGTAPRFFGEVPEHIHWRLDALACLREGRTADAMARLAKADESAPVVKGRLNDKAFESLRDYDDVMVTVLELVARDAYYWVPLEQVASLAMNPPRFPRDLIWFPASLELRSGEAGDVFLSALYVNSHMEADEQIKLGRISDWKDEPDGPTRGIGAKLFRVGDADVPLIDWRRLQLD